MNTRFPRLEEGLHVAAQIVPGDLDGIVAAGFRALICNRPDGEVAEQPDMDSIAAAAQAHGLSLVRIPVVGSAITEADIAAYRCALEQLPRPILAYCRSGNRSSVLWALARAAELPAATLIESARAAGHDLAALRPRLQARAAATR